MRVRSVRLRVCPWGVGGVLECVVVVLDIGVLSCRFGCCPLVAG